jgi:hypothetical protein
MPSSKKNTNYPEGPEGLFSDFPMPEHLRPVFALEDQRKEQAWRAWNKFLQNTVFKVRQLDLRFTEYYEGMVKITKVGNSELEFVLDDGEVLESFQLPPQVCRHSKVDDHLVMTFGITEQEQFWPLRVFSIGSIIESASTEEAASVSESESADHIHFSLNPKFVPGLLKNKTAAATH